MSYPLISIKHTSEAIPKYYHKMNYEYERGIVLVITGGTGFKTGTGKSHTAAKIGELTDPKFSIDNINYMPDEVMDTLDRFRAQHRIGAYAMMDEAEITAASTEFHSLNNKSLGYTFSTFRYLRCNYTFVSPIFNWIDFRLRPLVDLWGYTVKSLDEHERPVVDLYLYQVKTDIYGKNIYFKTLEFYHEGLKRIVAINPHRVERLSPALAEAYEHKAMTFKDQFRGRLKAEVKEYRTILQYGKGINYEIFADEVQEDGRLQQEYKVKGRVSPSTVARVKPRLTTMQASIVSKILSERYEQKTPYVPPTAVGGQFKRARKVGEATSTTDHEVEEQGN